MKWWVYQEVINNYLVITRVVTLLKIYFFSVHLNELWSLVGLTKDPFPLGLRSYSEAIHKRRDARKCCETDSYSATHLCWVLDSLRVRRTAHSMALSRLRAVKAVSVALLQSSMGDFERKGKLQLIEEWNFL